MAEKRRLQLEMEKCFKKIDEQLAVFDGMLESVLQTKPYGNQGLSAEEKLDPRQKERAETLEWLKTRIRKIKDEIDRTESKLEALDEKGGKRGKREADREEDELKRHLERATFHVTNLEVCMRLITNEKLESAVVWALLKEPLDMYVEALEPENEYDLATLQSLEPDDVYAELKFGDFISLLNAGPPVEESRPPPPPVEKPPPKPAVTKRVVVPAPAVLPPALPKPRVLPPVRPVVAAVRGPSWAAVAAIGTAPPATKVAEVPKPPAVSSSVVSSVQRSPPTKAEKKRKSCPPVPVRLLVKAKELEKTPLRSCVRLPRRRPPRVSRFTQTDGREPSPDPAVREPSAEMIAFLRAANADAVQRGYPADFFAFRPPFRLPTRDRHAQTFPPAPPLRLPPGWMPDTLEHYEKLDTGTLFYYFRNLTFHPCHLLVVRALQAKGWRLHSRLGSWFLRAGEPLEMGDGFERAPFHTFCFKEWDVKKIDDFRFEYECIDSYY
ncbi:Not1 domain, CCR4-Not complex component [Aphelenchoides fujianensis]|nr:Not1 domain, CCR4-Not complex component [Aphelenchoides fujianensis]